MELVNKLLKVRIHVAVLILAQKGPRYFCGLCRLSVEVLIQSIKSCRVISGIDVGRCTLKPVRNFSNRSLMNL